MENENSQRDPKSHGRKGFLPGTGIALTDEVFQEKGPIRHQMDEETGRIGNPIYDSYDEIHSLVNIGVASSANFFNFETFS